MTALIARRDDLPFQTIGDVLLVVVPRDHMLHALSDSAIRIWELLERPHTHEELVRKLCDEFDGDPADIARDVDAFLNDLKEKGLILTPAP